MHIILFLRSVHYNHKKNVILICVKCHSCDPEFFDGLDCEFLAKSGKFLLKVRADHSGKFAPREINYTVIHIKKFQSKTELSSTGATNK